ncbi:hypothetical protein PDESU_03124 [Pontiella desulfatans]|uniref:Uncharacterized protein n=1 Tax=Pontiella desulfatans TaxID=2750659 RepID=A0A6C2U4U4_PONDE|nr:hypothetical protein [Pontiella desulfatans]VGO14561.1 hypothetical protein PDESU_03124 [Pontiella desulfatans]
MTRREFRNVLLGTAGLAVLSGCKSRIAASASDAAMGDPYQCGKCGHLIRSTEDMTEKRCPRCYAKAMKRISEEEMATALHAD